MASNFKRLLVGLLFAYGLRAQAAVHTVTLTWADAQNPAGTTYSVYRATGLVS